MGQLYESLRRVLLLLRASGRWCLQTVLHLWRLFTKRIRLSFLSDQQIYFPGKPDTYIRSTEIVAASRIPDAYSLEERSLSLNDELGQASSSSQKQTPLQLDMRETPRRQSTSATFSPSGTTFVSSPMTISPRGSFPLPRYCKDKSDPADFKPRVTTPSKSRRYNHRPP
jgi:hypothetical protein